MKRFFLLLCLLAPVALFASSQTNDINGSMTGDNGDQITIVGGLPGSSYLLTATYSAESTTLGGTGSAINSGSPGLLYSCNITVTATGYTGASFSNPIYLANQEYRHGYSLATDPKPTTRTKTISWYVNGVFVTSYVDTGTYFSNFWNAQTLTGWAQTVVYLAPRHPQPLQINVVSTSSTAQTLTLINPAGQVVGNYGVGGNSTLSTSYQPPDSPVAGVYNLSVLSNSGLSSSLVGSQTLAVALATNGYSYTWSATTLSGNIAGAAGAAQNPVAGKNGLITNNSGSAQTVQFYGPDGSAVGLPITIPAGGTLDPGAMAPGLPAGVTSQTLTMKTGSGQTLGTITVSAPSDGVGSPTVSGAISQTLEPSTGSGATVTTGTTISSGSGGTSGTSVSTTTTSGQVSPNDFYKEIRDAIQDEAQISQGRSAATADNIYAPLALDDGHISDVTGAVNGMVATGSNVVGKMELIGQSFNVSELTNAMSSAGRVSELNFGTIPNGFGSGSYTIGATLGPWAGAISLGRSAMSFGLWFMFILSILHYFTKES